MIGAMSFENVGCPNEGSANTNRAAGSAVLSESMWDPSPMIMEQLTSERYDCLRFRGPSLAYRTNFLSSLEFYRYTIQIQAKNRCHPFPHREPQILQLWPLQDHRRIHVHQRVPLRPHQLRRVLQKLHRVRAF